MPYVPDPTGIWHEALLHLDALESRLDEMVHAYPTGSYTAGDMHQLSIGAIRHTILAHWQWTYMERALRPPSILVKELPPGVDVGHGIEPEQEQQERGQHGRQPGA